MDALQARPHITSFIEKICQENSIPNYKITDVKTNEKGEGYLGEIFLLTVNNGKKQMDMVVKAAFDNEQARMFVPVRLSYENEIYFYTKVHPTFQKLENDNGIAESDYVPKCLKVCGEEPREMLALENLRKSGFEMFDKKATLDHDHLKLIFETYGRFHAFSYVLRDQKPEEYAKLVAGLANIHKEFGKSTFFADLFIQINMLVQTCLIPGEDDQVIEKYKKYSGRNIVDLYFEAATKTDEYSGVLHGDCWTNNMMFKYENSGASVKKPIAMRLIDWQVVKQGSPVCDLSYFLYAGGSKESFDRLDDYLKIYHASFSSFVKKMGSDPDKLYPFSVLKRQWQEYAKFGMITAFSMLRNQLTEKEDVVDLTDNLEAVEFTEAFAKTKFNEDEYRKRVRNLILHMYKEDAL